MAEAGIAVAVVYFVAGSQWSPALWAAFTLLAVWTAVMAVRRDAGLETAQSYERWKLQYWAVLILGVALTAIWQAAPWLFLVAGGLAWFWIENARVYRSSYPYETDTRVS